MADHVEDRVAMASRNKDGTPDQTEGYEIIGDKETAIAATAEQLAQMAAAAAAPAVEEDNPDEVPGPSPADQERVDANAALLESARAEAEAEVESRHVDPRKRQAEVETTVKRSSRRSATEPTE